jgi:hypothetical protein
LNNTAQNERVEAGELEHQVEAGELEHQVEAGENSSDN